MNKVEPEKPISKLPPVVVIEGIGLGLVRPFFPIRDTTPPTAREAKETPELSPETQHLFDEMTEFRSRP